MACDDDRQTVYKTILIILPSMPETSSSGVWSSNVVTVKREMGAAVPAISPNPFRSTFRIAMPAGERAEEVSLMDLNG